MFYTNRCSPVKGVFGEIDLDGWSSSLRTADGESVEDNLWRGRVAAPHRAQVTGRPLSQPSRGTKNAHPCMSVRADRVLDLQGKRASALTLWGFAVAVAKRDAVNGAVLREFLGVSEREALKRRADIEDLPVCIARNVARFLFRKARLV